MMFLAKIRKHLALIFIAATLTFGIGSLVSYADFFDQENSNKILFSESEIESKLDNSLNHFDFLIPTSFSLTLNATFTLLFSILFCCLTFSEVKFSSSSPRSPPARN